MRQTKKRLVNFPSSTGWMTSDILALILWYMEWSSLKMCFNEVNLLYHTI